MRIFKSIFGFLKKVVVNKAKEEISENVDKAIDNVSNTAKKKVGEIIKRKRQ